MRQQKLSLAFTENRLVVATLVKRYEVLFPAGQKC